MASFHLTVLTAEGSCFDGDVASVVAPARDGYLGVLAGHTPLICALRPGVLTVRTTEGTTRFFAVGAGVLEVTGHDAGILADAATPAESRDAALQDARRLPAEARP